MLRMTWTRRDKKTPAWALHQADRLVVLASVLVASCTPRGQDKPPSPPFVPECVFLGSCTISGSDGSECHERVSLSCDDGSDLAALFAQGCTTSGGSYSPEHCPSSGFSAGCCSAVDPLLSPCFSARDTYCLYSDDPSAAAAAAPFIQEKCIEGADIYHFPGNPPDVPSCNACTSTSQCDDGNPCTRDDCVDSRCKYEPLSDTQCPSPLCQNGTCQSGKCVTTPVPDDLTCDDGNVCTRDDRCRDGSCSGSPFDSQSIPGCTASDQRCLAGCKAGVCTPIDGPCDDGDLCTNDDQCQAGTCISGPPTDCEEPERDCLVMPGTCVQTSGVCEYDAKPEGANCSAGDPCLENGKCDGAGNCAGGEQCPPSEAPECQRRKCTDQGCVPEKADGVDTCTPDQPDGCASRYTCQKGECAPDYYSYPDDTKCPTFRTDYCKKWRCSDTNTCVNDIDPERDTGPCTPDMEVDCFTRYECQGGTCTGLGDNCPPGFHCELEFGCMR